MIEGGTATRPIRILLADGQPLLRTGFRMVLGAEEDLDIVGEAGSGPDAVDLARRLLPDVVLMDSRMPRLDGVSATRAIAEARLPVRVLILTPSDLDESVVAGLRAGASVLVAKDASAADLARAIRTVAGGAVVVGPPIIRRLLDRAVDPVPDSRATPSSELGVLTEREREVMVQIARGLSNAEIAQALSVSETTVKTHVGHMLTKLGLRDRVQAAVLAYESGLVRPRRGDSQRRERDQPGPERSDRFVSQGQP
jgi:DNA-binding NarL/FixJ family response regulator